MHTQSPGGMESQVTPISSECLQLCTPARGRLQSKTLASVPSQPKLERKIGPEPAPNVVKLAPGCMEKEKNTFAFEMCII